MTEAAARTSGLPWEREPRKGGPPDGLERLADEILQRCRGEGPANCIARCPLRVDVRGYVQLTREGRYREALQKVRERLPFPGILGYLCTHPCELHCKRIDEDSAVRIRDIKRFLAEWEPGPPRHLLERAPAREETVAIVGGGPAGLLAAHDLARLGLRVTLLERETELGGCLVRKIPPWRLPRRVVDRDLSVVEALEIEVRTGVAVGPDVAIEALREEFGAVLLLPGYPGGIELLRFAGQGLRRTVRDTLWADPLTCETGIPGLFAGGAAVSGPCTTIEALAFGRRAAESAFRHVTGGDLATGREPLRPPRLRWTLEIDEAERLNRQRSPVMLQRFNDPLTEAQARQEAERCLDCECSLCVDDCEFLSRHCGSPQELARTVKAGLDDEASLAMVYSCNLCSLCATVCPESLDIGALLAEARRQAVRLGLGPLPQHKGTLEFYRAGIAPTLRLLMSEPGRGRSKRLFFTGCALPARAPKHTLTIYDELRRHYPGTGVMMHCCGAPAERLGMEESFQETSRTILRLAESVGAEELVTACPECRQVLAAGLPDLPVRTVWEMLDQKWHPPRLREGAVVAVHDSCVTRGEPGLHAAVRRLLESGGSSVRDVDYSGGRTRCCGHGGMIQAVDPDLYRRVASRRAGESDLPWVTYCTDCRMALQDSGARAIHLLDFLLEPDLEKTLQTPPPGRLARHANRLRTKWAFRKLAPLGAD